MLCREQVPRRRCRSARAILKCCNRVRDISEPSHASAGSRRSAPHDSLDRRVIWSKGQAVRSAALFRVLRRVLVSYLDVICQPFCRTCNKSSRAPPPTEKICHIYMCVSVSTDLSKPSRHVKWYPQKKKTKHLPTNLKSRRTEQIRSPNCLFLLLLPWISFRKLVTVARCINYFDVVSHC